MNPEQLIAGLQAKPLTLAEIGAALGVDRITVWRWGQGTRQPGWRHMDALRRLHCEEVGRTGVWPT